MKRLLAVWCWLRGCAPERIKFTATTNGMLCGYVIHYRCTRCGRLSSESYPPR